MPLPPPASPDAFTFVVLPDTQIYAAWKPGTFVAQTRWIAEHAASHRIAAVVHVGDVTNDNSDAQWSVASGAFEWLDQAGVPYLVVPGNHDLGAQGLTATRATGLDRWFAPSRTGLSGTFERGCGSNGWRTVRVAGGAGWLLLGLEFGARPEVLAWARRVIDAHAALPALVATHAYLYCDGQRYDRAAPRAQDWHPRIYPIGRAAAADGEDVYRALVAPCPSVRLVVSGHVLHAGVARRADARADGSVAHQLLANYQHRGEGGDGYLRCVRIAPGARTIEVRTYSPLLDRELDDDANRFVLAG